MTVADRWSRGTRPLSKRSIKIYPQPDDEFSEARIRSMQDRELFLCSQLMRVSQGRTGSVGNLEDICPDSCTITLDEPPPIGAQVTIRCVRCPLGMKSCTDCRFKGTVQCHENDPVLGCLIQVEFQDRVWSPEAWHPQHLTDIKGFSAFSGGVESAAFNPF
jgi:hypothetical protein